jgi:hypothetical protein
MKRSALTQLYPFQFGRKKPIKWLRGSKYQYVRTLPFFHSLKPPSIPDFPAVIDGFDVTPPLW